VLFPFPLCVPVTPFTKPSATVPSARVQYIRVRGIRPAVAARRLECAVVMKGVAAWGLSSEPTSEGSLRQDNLKICINIQNSGAFFRAHCETQD
jgi:hypothetical protein